MKKSNTELGILVDRLAGERGLNLKQFSEKIKIKPRTLRYARYKEISFKALNLILSSIEKNCNLIEDDLKEINHLREFKLIRETKFKRIVFNYSYKENMPFHEVLRVSGLDVPNIDKVLKGESTEKTFRRLKTNVKASKIKNYFKREIEQLKYEDILNEEYLNKKLLKTYNNSKLSNLIDKIILNRGITKTSLAEKIGIKQRELYPRESEGGISYHKFIKIMYAIENKYSLTKLEREEKNRILIEYEKHLLPLEILLKQLAVEKGINLKQLREELGVSKSTMTAMINGLCTTKFMEKQIFNSEKYLLEKNTCESYKQKIQELKSNLYAVRNKDEKAIANKKKEVLSNIGDILHMDCYYSEEIYKASNTSNLHAKVKQIFSLEPSILFLDNFKFILYNKLFNTGGKL